MSKDLLTVQLRATMRGYGAYGEVVEISQEDFDRFGDSVSKTIDKKIIPEKTAEVESEAGATEPTAKTKFVKNTQPDGNPLPPELSNPDGAKVIGADGKGGVSENKQKEKTEAESMEQFKKMVDSRTPEQLVALENDLVAAVEPLPEDLRDEGKKYIEDVILAAAEKEEKTKGKGGILSALLGGKK